MGFGSFLKKAVDPRSFLKVHEKLDPTGMVGKANSMIASGLGMGGDDGGGSAAPARKRYERKTRNRWKSKRQKKYKNKRMLGAGAKKKRTS